MGHFLMLFWGQVVVIGHFEQLFRVFIDNF